MECRALGSLRARASTQQCAITRRYLEGAGAQCVCTAIARRRARPHADVTPDERIELGTDLTVVRRKPFGGPLVIRLGHGEAARDFDVAVEVGDAVWVHTEHTHPGCTLEQTDTRD